MVVVVLGSSTEDGVVRGAQVELGPGSVRFACGAHMHEVRTQGQPCWGGKCVAVEDLSLWASTAGLRRIPGGGLVNSALELSQLHAPRGARLDL
jgi:hypothetical protein